MKKALAVFIASCIIGDLAAEPLAAAISLPRTFERAPVAAFNQQALAEVALGAMRPRELLSKISSFFEQLRGTNTPPAPEEDPSPQTAVEPEKIPEPAAYLRSIPPYKSLQFLDANQWGLAVESVLKPKKIYLHQIVSIPPAGGILGPFQSSAKVIINKLAESAEIALPLGVSDSIEILFLASATFGDLRDALIEGGYIDREVFFPARHGKPTDQERFRMLLPHLSAVGDLAPHQARHVTGTGSESNSVDGNLRPKVSVNLSLIRGSIASPLEPGSPPLVELKNGGKLPLNVKFIQDHRQEFAPALQALRTAYENTYEKMQSDMIPLEHLVELIDSEDKDDALTLIKIAEVLGVWKVISHLDVPFFPGVAKNFGSYVTDINWDAIDNLPSDRLIRPKSNATFSPAGKSGWTGGLKKVGPLAFFISVLLISGAWGGGNISVPFWVTALASVLLIGTVIGKRSEATPENGPAPAEYGSRKRARSRFAFPLSTQLLSTWTLANGKKIRLWIGSPAEIKSDVLIAPIGESPNSLSNSRLIQHVIEAFKPEEHMDLQRMKSLFFANNEMPLPIVPLDRPTSAEWKFIIPLSIHYWQRVESSVQNGLSENLDTANQIGAQSVTLPPLKKLGRISFEKRAQIVLNASRTRLEKPNGTVHVIEVVLDNSPANNNLKLIDEFRTQWNAISGETALTVIQNDHGNLVSGLREAWMKRLGRLGRLVLIVSITLASSACSASDLPLHYAISVLSILGAGALMFAAHRGGQRERQSLFEKLGFKSTITFENILNKIQSNPETASLKVLSSPMFFRTATQPWNLFLIFREDPWVGDEHGPVQMRSVGPGWAYDVFIVNQKGRISKTSFFVDKQTPPALSEIQHRLLKQSHIQPVQTRLVRFSSGKVVPMSLGKGGYVRRTVNEFIQDLDPGDFVKIQNTGSPISEDELRKIDKTLADNGFKPVDELPHHYVKLPSETPKPGSKQKKPGTLPLFSVGFGIDIVQVFEWLKTYRTSHPWRMRDILRSA